MNREKGRVGCGLEELSNYEMKSADGTFFFNLSTHWLIDWLIDSFIHEENTYSTIKHRVK